MLYSILNLIVDIVASTLGFLFWLRFWCQAVRVRPPSPFGEFMTRLTNWLVMPLRRVIPGVGGYDWASLLGAFLVALVAATILSALAGRLMPATVLLLALHQLASWILYCLMGALIIEVIFSWVNPQAPLAPFVRALNAPVMRPFRRILPPISGVDLSPILAFIVLRIALAVVDAVFRVA
ncbi:YggT family protein [Lacisediminimonas sp.]|uniref:YggT family protein n=1 Tax=Lacisediminimonas sp. TaxID=3060582 RepID=UPI00271FADFD|nr:YggT family protein [Lacisediminimonas sp.]MDO8298617.1 YggT family protein [Lacisediminimonas sp.]